MAQLLVIGFSKAIRGKSLSKNKPTCENAVAQAQYGSQTLRVMGSCVSLVLHNTVIPFILASVYKYIDCLLLQAFLLTTAQYFILFLFFSMIKSIQPFIESIILSIDSAGQLKKVVITRLWNSSQFSRVIFLLKVCWLRSLLTE